MASGLTDKPPALGVSLVVMLASSVSQLRSEGVGLGLSRRLTGPWDIEKSIWVKVRTWLRLRELRLRGLVPGGVEGGEGYGRGPSLQLGGQAQE